MTNAPRLTKGVLVPSDASRNEYFSATDTMLAKSAGARAMRHRARRALGYGLAGWPMVRGASRNRVGGWSTRRASSLPDGDA
jgi:hypothetical protein